MSWSGKAVDATVLTATIGVDGLLERYIGRLMARDDGFAVVLDKFRLQSVLILGLPAVINLYR